MIEKDLGIISELIDDETITEIMINGFSSVYVERQGKLELYGTPFADEKKLLVIVENLLALSGKHREVALPFIDCRLPGGSRVNITLPPVSLLGPMITIRKFSRSFLSGDDLVSGGTCSSHIAQFLKLCVGSRRNIIVSGGTGSGKTTVLNVISSFISEKERILVLEDTAELQLNHEHTGRLEAQPAGPDGKGMVTIRQMLVNALRMRPDRIIIGECRSAETFDMLQAMNTGHDGSMTTVHANSPRDCLRRIELMTAMAGFELPLKAVRELSASCIDVIVQVARFHDGSRKIIEISEVTGIEGDKITLAPIFLFKHTGIDRASGKITGEFKATRTIPSFIESLRASGMSVDLRIFE